MKVWDSKSGLPEKVDTGDTLIERAHALHLADKFEEAEALYGQLLEQNYDNLGLMATLGSLYVQQQKWGHGIHFLQMAMDGGLKEPDAYTNLAVAYQRSGQYDKARGWYEKSIQGDSTPEALTNYSGMFVEAGAPEKCISLCEQAIKKNPDLAMAHWNMALALLGEGVWDRAWEEHEWGFIPKGLREDRDVLGLPKWDGTPGQRVLIYGEQGLGDEIMFASMLPDILKTNPVVLECHARLETLFRKAFPQLEAVYGTRWDQEVSWGDNHKCDARLAIGSLGKFYRRSREAFPGDSYLRADPLPTSGKFRVGISWMGGGHKLGRVQKRSVPLTWWKSILNVPNVEFVSLQYTDGSEEDLDMMDALGYDIKRMEEAKAKDYYDTARLVASCDLVISVCTSVVHLAGALGVPCWVITPKFPAWRYQNQGGMPWYRSVRLYRSPGTTQDGWMPVIARCGYDLSELVAGKQKVAA
jgi:hypothetical protein